jgi:hypothetical protein
MKKNSLKAFEEKQMKLSQIMGGGTRGVPLMGPMEKKLMTIC